VIADVKRLYSGEEKYFITGWEAGGHTVWATIFQHPETLRGAAPVTPNYQGRWMNDENFSTNRARANLPIKILQAGTGPALWPNPYFLRQLDDARKVAEEHGFGNISYAVAAGKPHGALADEVMEYFSSLQAR